jgi:hypothetical protein
MVIWQLFKINEVQFLDSILKEKPHKCTLCSKSFPTPGDLKSHMYVHNGSWPFKCHICNRGFSKHTNLKNHLFLHTGERMFPFCAPCLILSHKIYRNTVNVYILYYFIVIWVEVRKPSNVWTFSLLYTAKFTTVNSPGLLWQSFAVVDRPSLQ